MTDDRRALTEWLREQARELGFHLFGVAPAVTPQGFHHLVQWIDSGYHAQMDYIPDRLTAYQHPSGVMEGVCSLVMLGFPYRTVEPPPSQPLHGRVARYAWGAADYHDLIHGRFKQLKRDLRERAPQVKARGVVDSAPLLEREFARLAGLGWSGKNTLTINKLEGSYFFLACLLLDIDLPADAPHVSDHCGTCTRCLDACPTDAFVSPGVLDSRRCISYLTIEHRDPIPIELRQPIGDWLFGCDVCQDVCPWNRRGSPATDASLNPPPQSLPTDLPSLFDLDEDAFRQRFRKTPLWRTRRRGILRNAAIVLGNQRDPHSIAALLKGLHDEEALVRGASAWALGQIAGSDALHALDKRLTVEEDSIVQAEITAALRSAETA
ncbi:tRNA epoxyqueuosine(34) reductase QueG [Roseimaritima ulvae]|uniref:Epoxyqueuosine reductase n=1 Tax=Roseimaritima ulvae TaxID=980254 RepID=A0A5B9QVQ0_9BACT|nr:tRNA epoxyqueuosine(34) reductase QueG [Roseimaritima ulvae]QEG41870.1 Epoxyqueuosine reductase [Roseimaritima ulvae]